MYNLLRKIALTLYKPFMKEKMKTFIDKRLSQDFSDLKDEEYILIHCSSVGEVNLSEDLVKKFYSISRKNILISVFTDTGYENAVKKYSDKKKIKVIYFPIDDKKKINENVSKVASIKIVRSNLVDLQRKISNNKNVILDGRDVGTVIFPNAQVKIFLIASPEERARRRYNEFLEKKTEITYDEVLKSIKERDHIDSTRDESPFVKANDAIELDSTNLTIDDVVNFISKEIEKNIN